MCTRFLLTETAITARHATARRAVTLMEVIAVTVVLGLLAAMSLPYFAHDSIANTGARGLARRVSMDALQAQRRAISTGDNHYLKFTKAGGFVTDYALYRRLGGGDVLVDSVHIIPSGVNFTTSVDEFEYTFTGDTLATYSATIQSADRTYVLVVYATTGKVTITEI